MSIPLGQRDLVDDVAMGAAGFFAAIAWALGWMSTLPMVLIVGAGAFSTLLAIHEWRWRRRTDPRTQDAIEDFMTLNVTDPTAAGQMLQEYFKSAAQRDQREFDDVKRRAVSDPWAARELVRLSKLNVALMTQRRRNAAKEVRRRPSGVEDLRWSEYVEGLARRQLAEAEALRERARRRVP